MLAILRIAYSLDYTLKCTKCGATLSLREVTRASLKPEPEAVRIFDFANRFDR
jgi:hypothetical protein